MITARKRDVRGHLALGSLGAERKMEDTELEEGEAYSYHDNSVDKNYDFDDTIDPDVSLSYIGEKLQHVLGHFRKDFEGGVSAENLGAKFGGYGSFLPADVRSPVWSHSRSPPRGQNYDVPRSTNSSQLEDFRHDAVISLAAPRVMRDRPASAGVVSHSSKKKANVDRTVKREGCMPPLKAVEYVKGQENADINSANLSEQKTLKVRIKVGSDNLSTQQRTAIYSGLGLDVSPSSSLEGSLSESEGMSHGPNTSLESPTSILQIMTSHPVQENLLLSPLADDLIYFTIKEKHLPDNRTGPALSSGPVSSGSSANGTNHVKDRRKLHDKKKLESLGNTEDLMGIKGKKNFDSGSNAASRKESEIDALACEELVSETLKLPIISNLNNSAEMPKSTLEPSYSLQDAIRMEVRDGVISGQAVEEPPLSPFNQYVNSVEKSKTHAARKLPKDKKEMAMDDISIHSMKEGINADASFQEHKTDLQVPKGKNGSAEQLSKTDATPANSNKKVSSLDKDGFILPSGKENPQSSRKEKFRVENSRTVVADASKESLSGSSSASKKNKSSRKENSSSRNGSEELKFSRKLGEGRDTYKEFFGEFDGEGENEQTKMAAGESLKVAGVVENGIFENGTKKERLISKRVDKSSKSEPQCNTIAPVGSGSGDIPVGDEALASAAPLCWVGCDKCQKWRLLPPGTNPNDLPEKWVCSMLDWLPGMNRCSISEDETSKATTALFQAPAPDAQKSIHVTPEISGVTSAAVHSSNENCEGRSPQIQSSAEKKKDGVKKLPYPSKKDGPAHFLDSERTRIPSSKNRSLNDVSRPSLKNEADIQLSKDEDLAADKHSQKQKTREQHSDGGNGKYPRSNRKRESDEDFLKDSKKVKSDRVNAKEDRRSDDGSFTRKLGRSSSSGSPAVDKIQISAKRQRDKAQDSLDGESFEGGNSDERELVLGKRKKRDSHGSETCSESLPGLGYQLPNNEIHLRGNDYKKAKKARISKSVAKESEICRQGSKTGKDGSGMTNKQPDHDLVGVDADTMKRKLKSSQPTTATSSSSKVGSSHKSRASLRDTRGSPAESVSSSPKLTSVTRKLKEEDIPRDAAAGNGGGTSLIQDELSARNPKDRFLPSPEVTNHKSLKDGRDNSSQDTSRPSKKQDLDQRSNDRQKGGGSHSLKSGREPSSRVKDKNLSSEHESKSGITKIPFDHFPETVALKEAKPQDIDVVIQENGHKEVKKTDFAGESRGKSVRENQSILRRQDNQDVTSNAACNRDLLAIPSCDGEKSSGRLFGNGADQSANVSEKGKSLPLPPSVEITNHHTLVAPVSLKINETEVTRLNVLEANGVLKAPRKISETDKGHSNQHQNLRHNISSGNGVQDIGSQSPARRDSLSQAATKAFKEAKDLKHLADRLKTSGSNLERTGLYFQAALKFLHGASLLESSKSDSSKHGEMYSSTAKLCEFCAHEYEKAKDLASAALAYKCMEVAYLKVVYSSNTMASRDRLDLLPASKINPPGESPSSSASDVDNMNNPATVDKVAQPKGVSPPQVVGSSIIPARKRLNFMRLLTFAQDVNNAMEASKKSRMAFSAANSTTSDTHLKEGLSCIRRALDFNFQDVEGLLRLVRLATEAISR